MSDSGFGDGPELDCLSERVGRVEDSLLQNCRLVTPLALQDERIRELEALVAQQAELMARKEEENRELRSRQLDSAVR